MPIASAETGMMGFTAVQPILRAERQVSRCRSHLLEPKKAERFEPAELVQQLAVGQDIIAHRASALVIAALRLGSCFCILPQFEFLSGLTPVQL
jgi:hypothetical protein